MNNITQDLYFKQSVIEYSFKHGVTAAAIRYKQHRKTIYRWREKYDGTVKSLADKSRRPHHHPKEHTKEEINKIKRVKAHNKEDGIIVLWIKLVQKGYTRSITGLYKAMRRLGIYTPAPSKKKQYVPKTYEEMSYPGQRIQIDVKYVPTNCLCKELQEMGERYYQYTAIDEFTRQRVLWASKEHSTYASTKFLEHIVRVFKYPIECVQTDNGMEFTNRLDKNNSDKKTMFEIKLEQLGIEHKLIKPRTPRHNGKVERSHRKDQERFYFKRIFVSFEDFKEKLKRWMTEYNNFPMKPLKWLSPNEKLAKFLA
jgi:transposase InsO family protein